MKSAIPWLPLVLLVSISFPFIFQNAKVIIGTLGSFEDSPLLYATYQTFPERFSSDALGYFGPGQTYGTLMNYVTLWFEKWLGIPAMFTCYIWIIVQTTGFWLAAYVFSRNLGNDTFTSSSIATAMFCLQPMKFNLASYGAPYWFPYAASIAIVSLIFALRAYLLNAKISLFVLLQVSALLHPVLTLYAIASVMFAEAARLRFQSFKQPWFFGLPAVLILPIAIGKTAVRGLNDLDPNIWLTLMKQNMHANVFAYPLFFDHVASVIAIFLLFIAASYASQNSNEMAKRLITLTRVCWLVGFAFFVSHLIAFELGLAPVLRLLGGRAIVIAAILSLFVIGTTVSDRLHRSTIMKALVVFSLSAWLTSELWITRTYWLNNLPAQRLLETQTWANQNTEPEAKFFVNSLAFRAISERSVVNFTGANLLIFYMGSASLVDQTSNYLSQVGLPVKNYQFPAISAEVDLLNKMKPVELLSLARRLGANYLVWPVGTSFSPAELVYENSAYQIIKVD